MCAKAVLLLFIFSLSAHLHAYDEALPRYALVIGNSNYEFAPLSNPATDAEDIAKKLETLRYRTTLLKDLSASQFRTAVADFYASIKEANAVSLFYYAGHGIQVRNTNYLIPVGVNIEDPEKLIEDSYSYKELVQELSASASAQNIIIMDACRNNPFENTPKLTKSLQKLESGLAMVEAPVGTLVAYSTEPGNVAEDGRGRNGTYTGALLRHIDKAETAEELFKRVRKDVLHATNNRQTPWEHSSLIETFYFAPRANTKIPTIVTF